MVTLWIAHAGVYIHSKILMSLELGKVRGYHKGQGKSASCVFLQTTLKVNLIKSGGRGRSGGGGGGGGGGPGSPPPSLPFGEGFDTKCLE